MRFWPLLVAGLSACTNERAPSVMVMGSYFPSWIVCAILGVVGASLVRVIFVRAGLDEVLPMRLLVYACLALALAFTASLLLFPH